MRWLVKCKTGKIYNFSIIRSNFFVFRSPNSTLTLENGETGELEPYNFDVDLEKSSPLQPARKERTIKLSGRAECLIC